MMHGGAPPTSRKFQGSTVSLLARCKELLEYNPETGNFKWLITFKNAKAGSIAGNAHRGYIRIQVDGVMYMAADLAWLFMTGAFVNRVDHKDTDGFNDRWENLRECTQAQNSANRKLARNNTTGFKGVCKSFGKFKAGIKVNQRRIHLGTFNTAEEASAAYMEAARKYFGEFARAE